nr:MAG TPA: hypothetical protein [Caudoviricetes sp.]
MKLELTYDKVLVIECALFLRVEETERNAQECAQFDEMDNDAKYWQRRTEVYRKVYNTVVAQREQADKEYEQAAATLKESE